jgi:hypothetical protein
MLRKTLVIDYSTKSTGYALFEGTILKKYGVITLGSKKVFKKYPFGTLRKLEEMAKQINSKVIEFDPDVLVIEEINRGIGRIQQKILNAGHFILLRLLTKFEGSLFYVDSNGKSGWRGKLGLALSDIDKNANKVAKQSGKSKLVDWKVLAERFVNKTYKLNLDVKTHPEHSDMCDAICLGVAFLTKSS